MQTTVSGNDNGKTRESLTLSTPVVLPAFMLCPCAGLVASPNGVEVDGPAGIEDEDGCRVASSDRLSIGPAGLLLDELESGMIYGRGAGFPDGPKLENGSVLEGWTLLEAVAFVAT